MDQPQSPTVPMTHVISPTTVSSIDEYSANPRFIELQRELRYVLSAGVGSLAPSKATTPEASAHVIHSGEETSLALEARAPSRNILDSIKLPANVTRLKAIQYLRNWVIECAPFLDKFDEAQHFGIQVPILAHNSPALLYAILAFSARQTERKKGMEKSYDSLELYQESIRLLSPSLQARDPNILVTVCTLACLELMSGSPRDWKRHLDGCASLFQSFDVTGFSGGVLQAVFWCYARMELCGVIISNYTEGTVLALKYWVPTMPVSFDPASSSRAERHEKYVEDLFFSRSRECPDMHANWAVYLCTRACDLLFRRIRYAESDEHYAEYDDTRSFADQWSSLWAQLQLWLDSRPPQMLPIALPSSSKDQLFPQIFFVHWAAISGNQLYHTACLLLIDARGLAPAISSPTQAHSAIWHAKRICGISLTNPHSGNLINAIQPLYVAGKHLSHPSEHLVIGKLLKQIEKSTGWGALWRLKDLEAVWGYDPGEILSLI